MIIPRWLRKMLPGHKGASAVEYMVLVALLALAILVSIRTLGEGLSKSFSDVSTEAYSANASGGQGGGTTGFGGGSGGGSGKGQGKGQGKGKGKGKDNGKDEDNGKD